MQTVGAMVSEIGRRGGTFKLSPGELLIYCRNECSKSFRSENPGRRQHQFVENKAPVTCLVTISH